MKHEELPDRCQERIKTITGKKNLSAMDFSKSLRITFPDGSAADFKFAFADSNGGETAVFTELCGYHISHRTGFCWRRMKNPINNKRLCRLSPARLIVAGPLRTRSRPADFDQENPLELRPKNAETPLMNPPSELGPNHTAHAAHAALPTTSRVRESNSRPS